MSNTRRARTRVAVAEPESPPPGMTPALAFQTATYVRNLNQQVSDYPVSGALPSVIRDSAAYSMRMKREQQERQTVLRPFMEAHAVTGWLRGGWYPNFGRSDDGT